MKEPEPYTIEIGDKTIQLHFEEFDTDIDVDELLVVDINNILGDVITFPVILNRIALLRAQQQSIVSESKLDLQIMEANLQENVRKRLTTRTDISGKISKPTVAEVENAVNTDKGFVISKRNHIRKERDLAYLDALYWSAKSKDDKLNKASEKIRPEEFSHEILEDAINGVYIKAKRSLIKKQQ